MHELRIGELFHARYEILAKLGKGGMGEVYRARQIDIEREVALKLLSFNNISDENDRERFLREFKILSRLSHSNIMAFYSMSVTEAGIPYAVCELLEGRNLKVILAQEENLEWKRVLKIALQICSGLEAAHELGVIHRDLKPDNIMLLDKPEPDFVKLIDFGLARTIDEACSQSQKLTFTGQLIGTVHYMSPEQCKGLPADQRSDIYSLACVIFEALSGKRLFDAETPIGILHKHANYNAEEELEALSVQAPTKLCQILLKCLEKSPEQRFSSIKELKSEFEALLSNEDLQKSSAKKASKAKGWTRARPCIPFVLLALVSIGVLATFYKARETRPGQTLNKEARNKLLPRSGIEVHKNMIRLIDLDRHSEAEELGSRWLDKYWQSASIPDNSKGEVLNDLIKLQSRTPKFDDKFGLFPKAKALISKLQNRKGDDHALALCASLCRNTANMINREPSLSKEALAVFKTGAQVCLNANSWDSWENGPPLGIADDLLDMGCTSEADALAKRIGQLDAHVSNWEMHDPAESSRYFELLGDLDVILDRTEQALPCYKKVYKANKDLFQDKQAHPTGLRPEEQIHGITLKSYIRKAISQKEFLNKQLSLLRKIAYLSEDLSAQWLTETINSCDEKEISLDDWLEFRRLFVLTGNREEALHCSEKALGCYKSTSLKHDQKLLDLYHSKSCSLMLLGHRQQALDLFRQASKIYDADKPLQQAHIVGLLIDLANCSTDKTEASKLHAEAVRIAEKLDKSLDFSTKEFPNRGEIHINLALALSRLRQKNGSALATRFFSATSKDLEKAQPSLRIEGISHLSLALCFQDKIKDADSLFDTLASCFGAEAMSATKAQCYVDWSRAMEIHPPINFSTIKQLCEKVHSKHRKIIVESKLRIYRCQRQLMSSNK